MPGVTAVVITSQVNLKSAQVLVWVILLQLRRTVSYKFDLGTTSRYCRSSRHAATHTVAYDTVAYLAAQPA